MAVERELRGRDLVASMGVAEEGFGARRRPSDRPAAAATRGPQHQRVLGIAAALHAEAAADVGRDHAQLGFGNSQHAAGELRAGAVRVLCRAVKRIAVAVGMILADCGARLDRIGVDAIVAELERDGLRRLGESRVGRLLVAHHQRERDIVGRFVPHRRRARFYRVLDGDHRRQRLVVDLDQLGGVARLLQRFGDDEGNAVADGANPIAREHRRATYASPSGRPCPRA